MPISVPYYPARMCGILGSTESLLFNIKCKRKMEKLKETVRVGMKSSVVWYRKQFTEITNLLIANLIEFEVSSGVLMGERYYEFFVYESEFNLLRQAIAKSDKEYETL